MATSVVQAFDVLLKKQQLTDKQTEAARTRIVALSRFFLDSFTMAQTPAPFGSYARGTICAGQRDIDVLAPFAADVYWQRRYLKGSRAFLYWVRDALNEHYGQTSVSSRQLAVRLDFKTIDERQLELPVARISLAA